MYLEKNSETNSEKKCSTKKKGREKIVKISVPRNK